MCTRLPVHDMPSRYGNHIVYVDESGDHGLETVDPHYPIFVLAFCVFEKSHYANAVVPAIKTLKFRHFGHDSIVLHEREIRKEEGAFRFGGRPRKQRFIGELTDIIEASNFMLISCVIEKRQLRHREHLHPYHLALGFCVETLHVLLQGKENAGCRTHVIVESRGKKEDRDLALEFRRVCDGANRWTKKLPYEIVFADKKANSAGLQLADLVARPIGLSVLRPASQNRAFDALKRKFFCKAGRRSPEGGFHGWGLKVFPGPDSEKPRCSHRG